MAVHIKICGLSEPASVETAINFGALYLGFVLYPPSPRHIGLERLEALLNRVPSTVTSVAVVVNADDAQIDAIAQTGVDALQLHGDETPERVQSIKERTGLITIKAVNVRLKQDVLAQKDAFPSADMLLFDAKPPKSGSNLPGGNGLSFDWRILDAVQIEKPWLLSGGLNAENITDALRCTGASFVDVSSGVESRPGVKDLSKIAGFLQAIQKVSGKSE